MGSRALVHRPFMLRLLLAAASCAWMADRVQAYPTFKVLVFSKTAGFRHDSIPNGITAIQALGAANNFTVDTTEDANLFTDANLAQYKVVVFLSTTGDVLNSTQEGAFQRFIQAGKGYVGIHSATDTEYAWAWYGNMLGAYFSNHPAIQNATIKVADKAHPSTASVPTLWVRNDEWYNFSVNPRGNVHVLATLDEGTYSGGSMGYDHPIAWCHNYDGGRAWYTAGGHTQASFSETSFRAHILGGIQYAANVVSCDCGATIESNFQKVVLDPNTTNPMELSVAPDGRVFFIERTGAVKVYKPQTAQTIVSGTLPVTTVNEDGLLGITLDPNFATNNWVYLLYSPSSAVRQNLSRFTLSGDLLNMGTEMVLLQIPTQRDECCHSAGSLTFGPDGSLYISTGDNTNPFDSDGYAPIDERAGRSAWDAQKSSSNRNDLRGKILRITPQSNGTYTVPTGNLFPQNGSNGRPEVYVMGCRNPFRITVDSATNWLYWGEVGPDANSSGSRGPAGLDEFNQARTAGNFGWPYCIGTNVPYNDYNFATGVPGALFNCASPVNNSPNNTGSQSLPASQGAMIYYPYSASSVFPELGSGGRTAMSGPVYHFNPLLASAIKLPAYYDKTLFIFDWSRNWVKEVKLDDNGNLMKINPFLPTAEYRRPIEMEMGPDGAIYMLEYGLSTNDARLVRIEYLAGGGLSPIAVASGSPTSGAAPLMVQFSSAGSYDPDSANPLTYAWSFQSNGVTDSTAPNPSHTYASTGNYVAQLTVTDTQGHTGVANVPISVGNTAPVVTISAPPPGGIYNWGDAMLTQVSVTDVEDGSTQGGSISCSRITIQPQLGHDQHSHPLNQLTGCAGTVQTPASTGHSDADDLYLLINASYTDNGAPGVAPLTSTASHRLRPKLQQAEFFSTQSGVTTQSTADVSGGGLDLSSIDDGDYISFTPVNLLNISAVSYRVASAGTGGTIEVRVDSPTGALISTAGVQPTGSWQTYMGVNAPITDPGGTHELFFVFVRNPGDTNLFNLNWIDFNGTGVAAPGPPAGDTVMIDLGSPDVSSGLTHVQVSDGDTMVVTQGGRTCRRNVDAATDLYFYFAVSDSFAFQGNRPQLYFTVEYYDGGSGAIQLQYDSSTGTGTPAWYRSGGSVNFTNTNTWMRTTFFVADAYLGNRQNNGADFRFSKSGGGFLYVDRVNVTTLVDTPEMGIVPSLIDRTVQKGTVVPTDSIEVTNIGGGALNFALSGYPTWMSIFPGGGSSTGEPDAITITYNTTNLPTGNYSTNLTVTDANAFNSPQIVPISFHFLAAGDFDHDGDVDAADFGFLQKCFSGAAVQAAPNCTDADLDQDIDVDSGDFNIFKSCLGGANLPPGC